MRKLWTCILEILDGAPAVKAQNSSGSVASKAERGQSLLEMAFISPLLIILLAGLVEIGWLANNYLNLLDVTRYGARRGATLTDERSPFNWDNAYSWVPNVNVPSLYQMEMLEDEDPGLRFRHREIWSPVITQRPAPNPLPSLNTIPSICGSSESLLFYSDIICTMLLSMPPLRMNPYNGVDDIIVSAFSLALVDLSHTQAVASTFPNNWAMNFPNRPLEADTPQLLVVGRYPTNANECQANEFGDPAPTIYDPRDPFDINGNGQIDLREAPAVPLPGMTYNINWFNELSGYDPLGSVNIEDGAIVSSSLEKQVGFMWYGNHVIENTGCIGSDWSLRDVENLVNMRNFARDDEERRRLPNQGIVLVEMFWEHEMLLQIPVLSPVFEIMARDGKPDLSLWAMFPLPAVEPYLDYQAPS